MRILYIAATLFEIAPFIQAKPDVTYLVTGVGSPATVYQLTKRLQTTNFDLVIQAGIAGSFDAAIKPGDVVVINSDNFADLGIRESNVLYSLSDMGFVKENEFPFQGDWLINPRSDLHIFPYRQARGITVNTVTDNRDQIQMLQIKYNPQVESMEGAACHYTCLLEKIPFIQIRSISNYVGERDKTRWKMKEAIFNLSESLHLVTNELSF